MKFDPKAYEHSDDEIPDEINENLLSLGYTKGKPDGDETIPSGDGPDPYSKIL